MSWELRRDGICWTRASSPDCVPLVPRDPKIRWSHNGHHNDKLAKMAKSIRRVTSTPDHGTCAKALWYRSRPCIVMLLQLMPVLLMGHSVCTPPICMACASLFSSTMPLQQKHFQWKLLAKNEHFPNVGRECFSPHTVWVQSQYAQITIERAKNKKPSTKEFARIDSLCTLAITCK